MNRVILSPEYFPNPTIGRPISNADIYVGIVDLDPTVLANQKQISVQQENGTIVAVAQPISTGAGGVPLYLGSPVTILVDGNYAIKVLDNQGSQVYYVPSQPYLASEVNNPDNFGASPSATAAVNNVAFQDAFDAGGYVEVSPGTYLLSTQLTASEKAFTLLGSGIGQTILQWEAGSASTGILITESDDSYFVNIGGTSLLTEQAGLGNAVRVIRSGEDVAGSVQNRTSPRVDISGLFMSGSVDKDTDGWLNGIYLTDVMNSAIKDIAFTGYRTGTAAPVSNAMLKVDGAFNPADIIIDTSRCFISEHCVQATGTVEGITATNSTWVNNTYGLHWVASVSQPGFQFIGNHVSTHNSNVYIENVNQGIIANNLFYKRSDSLVNSSAVEIKDGVYNIIKGNLFVNTHLTLEMDGVELSGTATANHIVNNSFQVADICTLMGANTVNNQVGKQFYGNVTSRVVDSSPNNKKLLGWFSVASISVAQSITDATIAAISYDDNVGNDDLGGFDFGGGPVTGFTVPDGLGYIDIEASISWDGSAVGDRSVYFTRNGTLLSEAPYSVIPAASIAMKMAISARAILVVEGDIIGVKVIQSSGGNLNVLADGQTYLRVVVAEKNHFF